VNSAQRFAHRLKLCAAPPHVKSIARWAGGGRIRVLDVGCGFGAAQKFKRYFPECEYHGLDRTKEYLLAGDQQVMHRFYLADLETSSLGEVPDNYFDAVVLSHVIEHLHEAEVCLQKLATKLKSGGIIYIEYPGARSLNVPHSGPGSFLHFHDDGTHVRVYSVVEVSNIMLRAGCKIITAGTRRDLPRLLLTPVFAARGLLRYGNIFSGRLWDAFGIAEVVVARRR
jgi:ubiquinone/menaquinone biosynthesis C-methylase UbiE